MHSIVTTSTGKRIIWLGLPLLLALWLVGAAGADAGGRTPPAGFTETFDDSSNVGGWSFGTGNAVIETTGGNPGAYLHDDFLDTFAPRPRTAWGVDSIFTGDYRDRGVTRVSIDLITHSVDFSADGRPLTLMLISDNDTPGDGDDDWAAYIIGPDNVPLPGQGWLSYAFDVPAASADLPAGWQTLAFGGSAPAPDWDALITDVDQLMFFYGDPTLFYIFQAWDLGLDNVSISAYQVFLPVLQRPASE